MKEFQPKDWSEFIGNKKAVKLLKGAFNSGIRSIILYGPVGVGKTTAATLLAKESGALYFQMDGSRFSKSELDKILRFGNVLLFIDEISRLNRTAQHSLLIPIQEGRLVLIGASWENPWKMLIPPLRSRSVLIEFKPLSFSEMRELLDMLKEKMDIDVPDDVARILIRSADGDIRRLQNLIMLWHNTGMLDDTLAGGVSDKDEFYDVISAMIKSIRGSDPDAGVYYLMRFIEGGGSPEYVARRLVILASEDIGNADPRALQIATSAMYAVEHVGMPEALFFLVQAAVYLATAPKSNATLEIIKNTREVLEKYRTVEVPSHLINRKGSGYKYPHAYGGWVSQRYMPYGIEKTDLVVYKAGYEKKMRERLKIIRKEHESSGQSPHQDD
jgi:putative ATPase